MHLLFLCTETHASCSCLTVQPSSACCTASAARCSLRQLVLRNAVWPLVPAGTGKTHTVKGVLNVWSLVAYQRYYKSLMEALTSDR